MSPYKILVFCLAVIVSVALFVLVVPVSNINFGHGFSLKLPTIKEFQNQSDIKYADISKIIKQSVYLDKVVAARAFEEKKKEASQKNVPKKNQNVIKSNVQASVKSTGNGKQSLDSLKNKIQKIEYPENHTQALKSFFDALSSIDANSNPIRIMHYGDSQIEGDRISSVLRNRLQFYFGGCGVGLIPPVVENFHSQSIKHSFSPNWVLYKTFGNKDNYPSHKRYGALLKFASVKMTQSGSDTLTPQAWITLKKSPYAYDAVKQFHQCRLFCGNATKPVKIDLVIKNTVQGTEVLQPGKSFQTLKWLVDAATDEVTLRFYGSSAIDVFGIALDDVNGVAVDNIPMRGSSGVEFTKTDLGFLKEMYQELNVKLIILQFGVNVVPSVLSDYSYYENALYQQLVTLKKICPDISILVVGLSDMSRKQNGYYVSYPNIELVRNAQKKAAFRAGCAFWDMYKAMGGKNSMPSWVMANPSLGSPDFTHFTPSGAKIIADMLYNAFILEYLDYNSKSRHVALTINKP